MSANDENLNALDKEIDEAVEEGRFDDAAMKLIDLAEATEAPEDRAQIIDRAATIFDENLQDPSQAVVLWGILAELHEELGAWAPAAQAYERIAAKGEDPTEALEALIELYGELEDWRALLRTARTLLGRCEDDEARIDRYRQIALIQKEALDMSSEALLTQERILELRPDDEEAFSVVESSYREGEQWAALQHLYEKRAEADIEEKTVWLKRAAEISEKLGEDDSEKSRLLEEILVDNPGDTHAFRSLETEYREREDWKGLSDLLVKRGDAKEDPDVKLGLYLDAAKLHSDTLKDPAASVPYYERALRVRKDHHPAIDGLSGALLATGQYELASKVFELKVHVAADDTQEIDARLALASLFQHKLGDKPTALGHFEKALGIDPDCRKALVELGADFVENGRWIEATPLLERALRSVEDEDEDEDEPEPALKAKLYRWLGRCAKETMNPERAREAYQAAHKLAPLDATDLINLADLFFECEDYNRAQELYQDILDDDGADVAPKRLNLIKMNLGACASKLGQTALALDYVSEMDEVELEEIGELERMVGVHMASENWKGVISFKEKILAKRKEGLERFQDQLAIADIYLQGLGDRPKAAAAYEEALTHGTYSRVPLLQLVQIHLDDKAFEKALGFLERLLSLEDSPEKKAKWTMSMAAVVQDGLGDPERASALFEATLEYDSGQLEAFQALVGILHDKKAWKELETAYQKMIHETEAAGADGQNHKLLFMLHRNLGEIYHVQMHDTGKAIDTYEKALTHHRSDEALREKLARLCVRTPDQLERAQFHYRMLISHVPERISNYHSLSAIWASRGNWDGSWRIAGLLCLFGKAMDAEKRLYQKHVKPESVRSDSCFDDDTWTQSLRSYEQDDDLSRIFQLIAPAILGSFFPKTPKDLGLSKKAVLDPAAHGLIFSVAKRVATLLGAKQPQLYVSGEGAVEVLQVAEDALAVSPVFLKEGNEKIITYRMARQMTYLRPEHRLARHFDLHALQGLYMAAGCAVNPNFAVRVHEDLPQDQANQAVHFIQEAAVALKQGLKPKVKEALGQSIQKVELSFGPSTIEGWRRGVELTATFAALAAVGDVLLVGRIVKGEVPALSTMTAEEKIRAIVGYALSERYSALRLRMGVAVQT